MTNSYSRFLTAAFCLFLGGLLAWHLLLPDKERSQTENRTLAQRPEFSWAALADGSYTQAVETYFADQFPLRDQWTGLKARAEQAVGKREFNGVYLCGSTLIAKVPAPDKSLAEKNLAYVRRLQEQTEARVFLGLIPSAAEIWAEQLPPGAENWDQAAFLEQANRAGIPMVDFHAALAAHRNEPIFYRTDHHWTTLGAFYGANAVLEALGRESLSQEAFTPEVVTREFSGTLYSTSGIHWLEPDKIEFWAEDTGLSITSWRTGSPESGQLYDRAYLTVKDKYSAFLGGNQPLCVIRNELLPDGGKLLLIRDSYTDALAPFLAQCFSEVHLLDLRYYRASPSQYAEENGIMDIVALYSIPNFITDRNLVLP